jgi:predicted ATP-dependent serine protease
VLDSLDRTLSTIIEEVERRNPAIVVVDSFRSLAQTKGLAEREKAPVRIGCQRSH